MTYKHIEESRETRLWITQVFMPVALIGYAACKMNPELKKKIVTKVKNAKNKIIDTLYR